MGESKLNKSCLYRAMWKKYTTSELSVKFYLGKNGNYSLRESISDTSEKLLRRSREEGQDCI